MSEFANLSPAEIRLLREHRAEKAMKDRPISSEDILKQLHCIGYLYEAPLWVETTDHDVLKDCINWFKAQKPDKFE